VAGCTPALHSSAPKQAPTSAAGAAVAAVAAVADGRAHRVWILALGIPGILVQLPLQRAAPVQC
jgi:hypothetical protein